MTQNKGPKPTKQMPVNIQKNPRREFIEKGIRGFNKNFANILKKWNNLDKLT